MLRFTNSLVPGAELKGSDTNFPAAYHPSFRIKHTINGPTLEYLGKVKHERSFVSLEIVV